MARADLAALGQLTTLALEGCTLGEGERLEVGEGLVGANINLETLVISCHVLHISPQVRPT